MTTTEHLVIALVAAVAAVAVLRFEVFCVGDLTHTPDSQLRYLTRTGWLVACVVSIPLGGIVYLYCGKRR